MALYLLGFLVVVGLIAVVIHLVVTSGSGSSDSGSSDSESPSSGSSDSKSSGSRRFTDFPWSVKFSHSEVPNTAIFCNLKNNQCLENGGNDSAGNKVVHRKYDNQSNQTWKIIPSNNVTEMYICNQTTGNCLENGGTASQGDKVVAYPKDDNPNKRWRSLVQTLEDADYPLWCNVRTGKCLDAKDDGTVVASDMTYEQSKMWAGHSDADYKKYRGYRPELAGIGKLVNVDMNSKYPYLFSSTKSKMCNSSTGKCISLMGENVTSVDNSTANEWKISLKDSNPDMYIICNSNSCLENGGEKSKDDTVIATTGDEYAPYKSWRPLSVVDNEHSSVLWCNVITGRCLEHGPNGIKASPLEDKPSQRWKL